MMGLVYIDRSGEPPVECCGTCFWSQALGSDGGECYCDHLLDIVDCHDKCEAYTPEFG